MDNKNIESRSKSKNEKFRKGKWLTPLILILSVIAFAIFLFKNSE